MNDHTEIIETAKRVLKTYPYSEHSIRRSRQLAKAVLAMAGEIERLKEKLITETRTGPHSYDCECESCAEEVRLEEAARQFTPDREGGT